MLFEKTENKLEKKPVMGSGCGSVGRAVASVTRGPWFESSHPQTLIWTFICLLSIVLKRRNKEKEAGNGPYMKRNRRVLNLKTIHDPYIVDYEEL